MGLFCSVRGRGTRPSNSKKVQEIVLVNLPEMIAKMEER